MKLWILFISALIVSRKAEKLLDSLSAKCWKHIVLPIWQIAGPKPGGKLWAAVQAVKGN